MPSSRRSRRAAVALIAVAAFLGVAAAAHAYPPWPSTALTSAQLAASSRAATKYGIPVNIERGVTTYKNGKGSTTADFNAEAQRLAWWYKQLYPRFGGSALVNWSRAAAAEMGKSATPTDVALATGNQQAALNGVLTGGFWSTVATLLPGAASVGAAEGAVGLGGAVDTTGTGAAATAGGSGTAAAGSAGASSAAGKAGSVLGGGLSSGTASDALTTAGMAALGGTAALFAADYLSADTKANLTQSWFKNLYGGATSYAWLFAVIAISAGALFLMATSWSGSMSGWGVLLARVPLASLLMVGVPVAVMAGLGITDQASASLIHAFPDGVRLLHVLAGVLGVLAGVSAVAGALGHSTIAHVTGTGGWFLGAFGLVISGAMALELIAREVAIYLTVLIVPFALVGEIMPTLGRWSTGLMRVLFVVIISKLVLILGLVMAGTLIVAGVKDLSVVMVIVALVALALMTLFPALIYGALIRVESVWHSQAARSAATVHYHPMSQVVKSNYARAIGGGVDNAALSQAHSNHQLVSALNAHTAAMAHANGNGANGNGHHDGDGASHNGDGPTRPMPTPEDL